MSIMLEELRESMQILATELGSIRAEIGSITEIVRGIHTKQSNMIDALQAMRVLLARAGDRPEPSLAGERDTIYKP